MPIIISFSDGDILYIIPPSYIYRIIFCVLSTSDPRTVFPSGILKTHADRKNYDIAELGLSVEAAKNLYTGRVNAEVVNLLLENARFAELTYRISQYFDDTFASGIAAQNAMLTTLSTLLRTKVKTPEAAKAAKDISLRRKPVYQGDLDDIEMYFMAAVKEIKKGIGSHYAEQEAMSKKVAEKMFTELTKGQDVQHPTITAEQLTDAMLDRSEERRVGKECRSRWSPYH